MFGRLFEGSLGLNESDYKDISLRSGSYNFMASPNLPDNVHSTDVHGMFHLEVFGKNGQKIASDQGNMPGCVYFSLFQDAIVRFKVTRYGGQSSRSIPFKVMALGF